MSGEENRKIFFNDRGLDLSEGYQILRGGVDLKDINNNGSGVIGRANFIKVLLLLLRKERVNEGSSIFCIFIAQTNACFCLSASSPFGRCQSQDEGLGNSRQNQSVQGSLWCKFASFHVFVMTYAQRSSWCSKWLSGRPPAVNYLKIERLSNYLQSIIGTLRRTHQLSPFSFRGFQVPLGRQNRRRRWLYTPCFCHMSMFDAKLQPSLRNPSTSLFRKDYQTILLLG